MLLDDGLVDEAKAVSVISPSSSLLVSNFCHLRSQIVNKWLARWISV
jgi:hypothetical protein